MSSAWASREHRIEALKRFEDDTKDHQIDVLMDNGVYRHIRYGKPKSSTYAYTLTTFPGYLVVAGDMGEFVFSRLTDMFSFFRGDSINPGYWAEKLLAAPSKVGDGFTEVDDELAAGLIWREALRCRRRIERSRIPDAVLEELREDAIQAFKDLHARVVGAGEEGLQELYEFEFEWAKRRPSANSLAGMLRGESLRFTYSIDDAWDHTLRRYTPHFLWILWAIVHGIQKYDALKSNVPSDKV